MVQDASFSLHICRLVMYDNDIEKYINVNHIFCEAINCVPLLRSTPDQTLKVVNYGFPFTHIVSFHLQLAQHHYVDNRN